MKVSNLWKQLQAELSLHLYKDQDNTLKSSFVNILSDRLEPASLQEDSETQLRNMSLVLSYLKARRDYLTRWERDNALVMMDSSDRIRKSAQRVGLALPCEYNPEDARDQQGQDGTS